MRSTIKHMVSLSVIAAVTLFLMPAPTVLYDADLTPVVTLPAGYFVIQTDGDAPSGYIAVMYDDLVGLVSSSAVTPFDYTPAVKYEKTVKFKVNNDGQPINMRSAPQKNAKVLTVLPDGEVGRSYGYIDGDQLIHGAGERWYFVAVGEIKGYCYGAHITVDNTPPNIIEREEEENPPSTPTDALPEQAESDAPPISVIILIVALCVPVPFIMLYLFRKPQNKNNE